MNTEHWKIQKMCTDMREYGLIVEKQKTSHHCSQKRESWKWAVAYHGTLLASGSVNSLEEAQNTAVASVPQ